MFDMLGTLFGAFAAAAINSANAQPNPVRELLPHIASTSVTDNRPAPPVKRRPNSLGVQTSGPSAFVADMATGKVLFAKDPHRVMPIASLTKLVTAMVFLDLNPDLNQKVVIAEADQDHVASIEIPTGETLTLDEVFKAMLIGSVNASANAVARVTVGQERFVQLMNKKVQDLGLKSPVFVEPSGVDPRNRANAADVAAILSYASGYAKIRQVAQLSNIVVHDQITKKELTIKSTNLLLGSYLNKQPYKIVAAKTGSLPEAGYCMAQVTSNADGHQIVAVELGSDNHFARYQDIKALTTWAFDAYEWK